MCGIYGMIFQGGPEPQHAERAKVFFNVLAVTAAERGTDATGLATLNRDAKTYQLYKDVVPSYQIIRRETWQTLLSQFADPNLFAIMGHTRRKTHGENIEGNAHPFEFVSEKFGALVGSHNGVVTNHKSFGNKFDVDSANVLYALSELSVHDWCATLSKIEGSFALAMARNGFFYLARNSGSPCYTMEVPSIHCTAYASSPHMLLSAAGMSGLKTGKIQVVKAAKLYRFESAHRLPTTSKFTEKVVISSYCGQYGSYPVSSATDTTYSSSSYGKRKLLLCEQEGCYTWANIENMYVLRTGKRVCTQCKVGYEREGETLRPLAFSHTQSTVMVPPAVLDEITSGDTTDA